MEADKPGFWTYIIYAILFSGALIIIIGIYKIISMPENDNPNKIEYHG